jgi:serine/threonine protein kinase
VKTGRWIEVTESQYPWEREALGYLREKLPDTEPFRAWSNFEFVALDGSLNEVDLLVVSLYKIYLVEIKSRPGRLKGDAGTWTWSHEGRDFVYDNPLLLANRKAKKFKSLLQRQGALRRHRAPYVEPIIFLSNPALRCDLTKTGKNGVYLSKEAEKEARPDIVTVLAGKLSSDRGEFGAGVKRIDRTISKAVGRAMEQAGIRPSQRHRKVGDYVLERLMLETDVYQDWEASHVNFPKSKRRIRVYPVARQSSEVARVERRKAADPKVEDRPGSVGEFLQLLEAVEEELTTPEPEETVHPLDARAGDHLQGGFDVKRRLGKGSTSVALLVERNTQEGVLKVALDTSQNQRLAKEGKVLKALRHQNIVELYEQCEINGHVVLFLAKAGADTKSGTYTLAERIREEDRLSLDLLQRFGDELLNVLGWLEAKGISHRDIKPDNIGVATTKADKALTLVLFDFSLADTPLENIRAGTPPYLDSFLHLRKPPRWDTYAERFAAAMTLYEMATGQLPTWGDGQSDPSMLDCEMTLDSELFDPAVREGLSQFFGKGLARDFKVHFDNAEEMRRAWFRVFEHIDQPVTATDHGQGVDFEAMLEDATKATPISALGLSARVLNALDRIGAHTLGELVRVPRIRLYRNKDIGQKTVKEIRELAERVAEHLAKQGEPPKTQFRVAEEDQVPVDPQLWSVDLLSSKIVGSRADGDAVRLLKGLLGLHSGVALPLFAPQQRIAETFHVNRTDVQDVLEAARGVGADSLG